MRDWIIIGLIIAFLVWITGCSFVGQRLGDDLVAFRKLADQEGTPGDQACARILSERWQKLTALLEDRSGGLIAAAYRAILVNRIRAESEQLVTQNCGQFAAEIAVAIGRHAR
ncbi:MAG TPA: hypothetical protein VNL14_16580 [Candidatus Acidoferrales bacterium]|nr:hypothetical protein [Candidatus Acidoferrales bacterium]